MNKNEILNLTPEQATKLGEDHFTRGFSIHYNPYRNIDTIENPHIAILQENYINAWKNAKSWILEKSELQIDIEISEEKTIF